MILDLFAGPGGWDVGAQQLGLHPLGVEIDAAACARRRVSHVPWFHPRWTGVMMDDMPAGLVRLKAKAEACNWRTSTNRATGYLKEKRIDSWLLRIQKDAVRLAATWESTDGGTTWAFRSCLRQRPFSRLNSREAVALIELTREVAQ